MKWHTLFLFTLVLTWPLHPGLTGQLLERSSGWTIPDALVQEVSGERAKAHVIEISRWYREDGTPGFHEAASYVAAQARKAGLEDVHSELFPIDGVRRHFNVQSRYAWTPRRAELWLTEPREKLADFAVATTHLATWSAAAELEAPLVDIGEGRPSDYEREDVRGAIVFTSRPPADVQHEAVARRGAVGIVSWWSPPARAAFPEQVQWLDTTNNRSGQDVCLRAVAPAGPCAQGAPDSRARHGAGVR